MVPVHRQDGIGCFACKPSPLLFLTFTVNTNSLVAAASITGFDASGHISEETRSASTKSARGILTSAFFSGLFAFVTSVLFLFCTPPLDVWHEFTAQQPFVQVYALALGRGGAVFMACLAVVGLMLNTSISIVASSRLVFAVARDGVLPLSGWVGKVTEDGRPKNAVTVMTVFGALILCTILPSTVAFTSLVSAAGTRKSLYQLPCDLERKG